jgi:hypothetical protein
MKIKLALLLSAAIASASVALADTLVLNTNSYSNGGNGGSYTASAFGTSLTTAGYSSLVSTSTSFETFCLEPTEYFNPGNTYNFTIASYADGGANNAHGGAMGDPLSLGTTYLYSKFATGLLAGFDYSAGGHQASNLTLQRAIWYLEDDYTAYSTATNALASNIFLTAVANLYGGGTTGLAAAQANASAGAYGVYALNLTSGTTKNQSQLYFQVPESSSTLALLGLAMVGLLGFRRKISS